MDAFYEEDSFDEDSRQLCPVDQCVGLLDERGICSQCTFLPVTVDATLTTVINSTQPESLDGQEVGDWDKRTLCSNENCVGVLDLSGHCGECGACQTKQDVLCS